MFNQSVHFFNKLIYFYNRLEILIIAIRKFSFTTGWGLRGNIVTSSIQFKSKVTVDVIYKTGI